jgi:hypothetical protein
LPWPGRCTSRTVRWVCAMFTSRRVAPQG